MKKIAQIVVKSPRLVLLGLFIATIAIGFGLTKLETKNNQDSELPEDDEIVRTNDYIKEVFGKKEVLMIGIESKTIYNKSTLNKVAEISKEIEVIDGVIADEISSISTINNIQGKDWGLEVGPLMDEVPQSNEEIQRLKQEIASNDLVNGRLVSKDGTFTAIIANLEEEYDQTAVHTAVLEILEKYKGEEKYFLAGSPTSQHEIDSGIEKDIGLLFPLALVLLLIGYFLSFRTGKGVILPFLVVLLSIIWTMGLMGHIGFPITVVSSVVPMLMIAVSSSYGIHVLHRYYEEVVNNTRKEAARLTIEKIGPAVLMTGITSALGSATLIIFKVTSIQEFGIITAIGILSTLVLSVLLIPAILALSKKKSEKKNPESKNTVLDRFLLKLAHISIAHKKKVLGFTIALLIISIFGIMQIRIGADFVKYFPKDHALTTAFEKFNDKLGGVRSLDIMIEAENEDQIKDPVFLKKIADFQKFAESQEGVGYSSSFSDIIKRINLEVNDGNTSFNTIPDDQNTIAQYLLLYSISGDPGDFGDLVDYDYQRAKVKLFLTTSEQADHIRLYETFKSYAATNFGETANVEFGGEVMFWLAQVNYIVIGKIQNILLAIFVVLIFCMLVLRSFVGGILSVVPLTVSSILTFGVMGFLGIRMEAGTAIITAIGIGIGVDFAIHFLLRFQEEIKQAGNLEIATQATLQTSGKAIVYDVISNVLGFMVFIFSGFLPIQYFGWLISLTMITVAFGSLVFFPALIAVFKPKFYTKHYTNQEVPKRTISMVS
ncbi:efflux RND transporter permease subunit [Aquimarina sp. 2201CG5-10]|uniref:efflux RND transporter permease subunit n=1 Tax=Aquimarina callyspongiae TaxID=3098150 RepID=UPI002AB594F0|nr:MMPL family transporter [Aquimarina sp. 2201CG5-10]MDY8138351.1 MMPL family transporter [Aquimarina sp. 2201CG5-10]